MKILLKPLHDFFSREKPILNSKISIKLENDLLLESLVNCLNEEQQHCINIRTKLLSDYFVTPKQYENTSIMDILDEQLKFTPIRYKERRNFLEIY